MSAGAPHENAFQKMLTEKPDEESVSHAASRYMTEEYARIARSVLARQAVRKVIPPLRLGQITLDLSFLVLFVLVQIAIYVAGRLPF